MGRGNGSWSSVLRLKKLDWLMVVLTAFGLLRWGLLMSGSGWFFGLPLPNPTPNYWVAVIASAGMTAIFHIVYFKSGENDYVNIAKYITWAYLVYYMIARVPVITG